MDFFNSLCCDFLCTQTHRKKSDTNQKYKIVSEREKKIIYFEVIYYDIN